MKAEEVYKAIENNKELMKNINSLNYYSTSQFFSDAERYIKAIKERRMICSIGSVSRSGMSRTMKFVSCEQLTNGFQYLNYFCFFKALGYRESKQDHYFTIGGCGMDMVFHTNYSNIYKLRNLGFITKEECDLLSQMTPQVI